MSKAKTRWLSFQNLKAALLTHQHVAFALKNTVLSIRIAVCTGKMACLVAGVRVLGFVYKSTRWRSVKLIACQQALKLVNVFKLNLRESYLRLQGLKLRLHFEHLHRQTGLDVGYRLGGRFVGFGSPNQVSDEGAYAVVSLPEVFCERQGVGDVAEIHSQSIEVEKLQDKESA